MKPNQKQISLCALISAQAEFWGMAENLNINDFDAQIINHSLNGFESGNLTEEQSDELTYKLRNLLAFVRSLSDEGFKVPDDDPSFIRVKEKWGNTHHIEAIRGASVDLSELNENESTCWGDGETYHFKLTKKS